MDLKESVMGMKLECVSVQSENVANAHARVSDNDTLVVAQDGKELVSLPMTLEEHRNMIVMLTAAYELRCDS